MQRLLALATLALDGGAAGPRGGAAVSRGGSTGFSGRVAPHHFHGGHTRVFVGGTFFFGPYPYYYWPGYYYAAPVVAAPVAYWYYCAPLAAYYPYVQDCPGGWQLVEPHPY